MIAAGCQSGTIFLVDALMAEVKQTLNIKHILVESFPKQLPMRFQEQVCLCVLTT